jgi:hypothetical protein
MRQNALRAIIISALLLLSACDSQNLPKILGSNDDAGAKLDAQAIRAGILPDPADIVLAGRFETRSDLGTDKFCAIKKGNNNFRIGALAVFGPESKCEGQGSAIFDGDKVHISMSGKEACAFDAIFDGITIQFAGSIPEGCQSYCNSRGSFSGTSFHMVEQGDESARKVLGRDAEKLCG